MMMMMRPNAFIHSFIRERERERKRGKSLVSRRGLSSPHANENKKETKRGESRFFVVVYVVVVLLKRQKRESVWSQRHKGTHFFHHLMGFERWLFHKIPLYTIVQRYRNKVSSSRVLLFTFAFGTEEELLLVSEKPSSSFPSFPSSKVVVILSIMGSFNKLRTKKTSYTLYVVW